MGERNSNYQGSGSDYIGRMFLRNLVSSFKVTRRYNPEDQYQRLVCLGLLSTLWLESNTALLNNQINRIHFKKFLNYANYTAYCKTVYELRITKDIESNDCTLKNPKVQLEILSKGKWVYNSYNVKNFMKFGYQNEKADTWATGIFSRRTVLHVFISSN